MAIKAKHTWYCSTCGAVVRDESPRTVWMVAPVAWWRAYNPIALPPHSSGALCESCHTKACAEHQAHPRSYRDYSSLEGVLVQEIRHGRPQLLLRDSLTGLLIPCGSIYRDYDSQQEWLQRALQHVGHRVGVTGLVSYRDDQPHHIQIEEPIRIFPGPGELPPLADQLPIDITGGLSSEDYVRKIRDE